ncbi:MAG TPA: pyridoxamine 5'-phosphate oxidase family protein [Clostridiales bacterium]|nr:pyridoxamine 5'-phosphate oxidase family protein [Clostridiales bacterium]
MFHKRLEEIFQKLGESQIMCLATSSEDRVTARSMSVIVMGQKFYFQTDRQFLKYNQIVRNPRVALCFNNIQIEGICKEQGHPLSAENSSFSNKYNEYFKGSFDKYSHMDNEVVLEVQPKLISLWGYENGEPYQEFFDFENDTHRKSFYTTE